MNRQLSFEPVFGNGAATGRMGCVNVDVDTMASDLNPGMSPEKEMELADISWRSFIPRILKLFREAGIKATFFVVGKHAELASCRENLKAIIDSGHEVANHTMNHRKQFSLLSKSGIEREIRECHDRLTEICKKAPVGFRAPGYVINSDVIDVLRSLGYRYDASLNLSKFHNMVKRIYRSLIIKDKEFLVLQDFSGLPRRERVYKVISAPGQAAESPLVLFPINIIPLIQYTFISGSLINFGYPLTRLAYRAIRRKTEVLNFELHDIEFSSPADMPDNGLKMPYFSSRYAHIPMEKRERYFRDTFRDFQGDFRIRTFADIIDGINEDKYR